MSLSALRQLSVPKGLGVASFSSSTLAWADTASWVDSDADNTIEFWVRWRSAVAGFEPIATKGTTSPTTGYYIFAEVTPHASITICYDDTGGGVAEAGITPVAGSWHYVAFVYSAAANTVQGYHATETGPLTDGTLTSSVTGPTGNTSDFRLGGNTFSAYAPADMAFYRQWNVALDRSKIQQRYNKHLLPRAYPGLVFHWDAVYDPRSNSGRDMVTGKMATVAGTVSRDTRPARPVLWGYEHPHWQIAALGGADSGAPAATTRRYSLTLSGVG